MTDDGKLITVTPTDPADAEKAALLEKHANWLAMQPEILLRAYAELMRRTSWPDEGFALAADDIITPEDPTK